MQRQVGDLDVKLPLDQVKEVMNRQYLFNLGSYFAQLDPVLFDHKPELSLALNLFLEIFKLLQLALQLRRHLDQVLHYHGAQVSLAGSLQALYR